MVVTLSTYTQRIAFYFLGYRKKYERRGFFFHYQIDRRSKSSDDKSRGGKTIWGSIAGAAKTYGYTFNEIMWGVSWVNLQMMMADMPWYEYGDEKDKEIEVKTKEQESAIFGKYAKR